MAKNEKPDFVAVPPPHLPCAICRDLIHAEARYPRKVCADCAARAADDGGRRLAFENESISGGFVASYRDTGKPSPGGHACWIDGIACHADEHYFGGIVVQRCEMPKPRTDLADTRVTLPCALAWRAIAEIARRRHRSHRLRLEQYHPGASMRGVMALWLEPVQGGPAAAHHFDLGGPEPGRWRVVAEGGHDAASGTVAGLLGASPEHVITRMELHARFPPPASPLPSGGRFLRAIRLVAMLLERRVFDRRHWRATLALASTGNGFAIGDWHTAFIPPVQRGANGDVRPDDQHRLSQLVLVHSGEHCVFARDQYTRGLAIDLHTDRLVRMTRDGLTPLGTVTEHHDAAGASLSATADRLLRTLHG